MTFLTVPSEPKSPAFNDLPLRPGDPPYSAWGLWGKDDNIGTLNWLSSSVIREARSEIREGHRFSLNWCLSKPTTPGFGRHEHTFEHSIVGSGCILDDTLTFNTQKSSQWDGLRHFAYQKEGLFYNGRTREEVLTCSEGSLGIHWWHKVGGIATRGILLDYWSYAEANDKRYDPSGSYAISFQDLMACLRWQQALSNGAGENLEIRAGDILLIRTGYTAKYHTLSEDEESAQGKANPPASCGVKQDLGLLEWLWDGKFAAVGGDAPGWEAFPGDGSAGFSFHEVLIAGWGCPIAELLWLEDLAEWCKQKKRWTFFLASCPLNVRGGVASPANMIALV